MFENPFDTLRSVTYNGITAHFDGDEDQSEAIEYIKKILADNPSAKIYAKVRFGHFEYRIV